MGSKLVELEPPVINLVTGLVEPTRQPCLRFVLGVRAADARNANKRRRLRDHRLSEPIDRLEHPGHDINHEPIVPRTPKLDRRTLTPPAISS